MTEHFKTEAFRTAIEIDRRRTALVSIEREGGVDADLVRRLRFDLFRGDALTQDEADALFAIERNVRPDCPAWRDFFVDAIVDFLLWQQRPSGVLSEAQAEWLVSQADSTKTLTAFATLVTALEEAHRTPGWFAAAVRGRVAKGWAGAEIARAA
ncbi:MAG TPA: hypothetical protein PKA55_14855 [Rhodoblastus sp.]|nr:hypothetical protein [Rhodoblastus sp.]